MDAQRKVDTKNLEKRVTELQKNLAATDSGNLLNIIHRPGWTTVLDVEFAEGILEVMNQQALALNHMRNSLQKYVEANAR